MSTQALEFNSASEMRAHYKAVRERLNPTPPPIIYRPPAPAVPDVPEIAALPVRSAPKRGDDVRRIMQVVCRMYGIAPIDLISKRRTKNLIWPRHIAYYVASKMTTRSYPEIGRIMGGRDHTTVMHGRQKIERRLIADPAVAPEIIEVMARVRSAASPATYSQETADAHASR